MSKYIEYNDSYGFGIAYDKFVKENDESIMKDFSRKESINLFSKYFTYIANYIINKYEKYEKYIYENEKEKIIKTLESLLYKEFNKFCEFSLQELFRRLDFCEKGIIVDYNDSTLYIK